MRDAYLELVEAMSRGEMPAETFRAQYARLPDAPTPYGYANDFKELMQAGANHPEGFAFWLRAALPHLLTTLRSMPDELDVAERLEEFCSTSGSFAPAEAGRFANEPSHVWTGVPADSNFPVYVIRLGDPVASDVKRYDEGASLDPEGARHVVLVPSDFAWMLHDAYVRGEAVVRTFFALEGNA